MWRVSSVELTDCMSQEWLSSASSHQLLLEKEELEDSCLTRISALSSLLLSSVSDSKQRFSLSELFIRIYSGITQVFQFSIIIGKFSKVPD